MVEYHSKDNVLKISGSFATTDFDAFTAELDKIILRNPKTDIILEMSNCKHLTSLTVRQMLRVLKKLRETNNKLIIKNPSAVVQAYLNVTKLNTIIEIIN